MDIYLPGPISLQTPDGYDPRVPLCLSPRREKGDGDVPATPHTGPLWRHSTATGSFSSSELGLTMP